MEAGAEDMTDDGERWVVTSAPADLTAVRDGPRGRRHRRPSRPSSAMVPTHSSRCPTRREAKKVLRLLEALDDHDDVQNVYANFDIPDEVLAAFEG